MNYVFDEIFLFGSQIKVVDCYFDSKELLMQYRLLLKQIDLIGK